MKKKNKLKVRNIEMRPSPSQTLLSLRPDETAVFVCDKISYNLFLSEASRLSRRFRQPDCIGTMFTISSMEWNGIQNGAVKVRRNW